MISEKTNPIIDEIRKLLQKFNKIQSEKLQSDETPWKSSKKTSLRYEIFEKLKNIGLKPEIDDFKYVLMSPTYIFILLGISFSMIISSVIFYFNQYIISLYFLLIIIMFIILLRKNIMRKPSLFKKFIPPNFKDQIKDSGLISAKNIKSHVLSQKNQEFGMNMGKIILFANYDFVSYKLPLSKKRKFLLIFGSIVISIIIIKMIINIGMIKLLFYISSSQFQTIKWILLSISIVNCVFTIIFIFKNEEENLQFIGATGNLSSCVVLLNLIQRIKTTKTVLNWCDLDFVFLDGEDDFFQGSKNYIQTHYEDLQNYKDVYYIYLDGILKDFKIKRPKSGDNTLSDIIYHHALNLNIYGNPKSTDLETKNSSPSFLSQKRSSFIPDLIFPFGKLPHNFEICYLWDPNYKSRELNSDFLEIVDYELLKKVVDLLYTSLLSLDDRIDKKIGSGE